MNLHPRGFSFRATVQTTLLLQEGGRRRRGTPQASSRPSVLFRWRRELDWGALEKGVLVSAKGKVGMLVAGPELQGTGGQATSSG